MVWEVQGSNMTYNEELIKAKSKSIKVLKKFLDTKAEDKDTMSQFEMKQVEIANILIHIEHEKEVEK